MSEPRAVDLLEYEALDGHRSSARLLRSAQPDAPVYLCLPAMGVAASHYEGFAAALQASGAHVALADLRGLGTSSVRASRRCDFGYHEILTKDLPALVEVVRREFPSSRRILFGHSLGGQLWSLYLSVAPDAGSALVTIASCNVHYLGWETPDRYRVLAIALLFRTMGKVLGYVPAGRFGFAGNEAKRLIQDWSSNCLTGNYVVANDPCDYEQALSLLDKRVLALSLAFDHLAPRQSVDNLVGKMKSARITRRHLAASDLGLERVNHFSWRKRPDRLVELITAWTKQDAAESSSDRTLGEAAH